MPRMLVLGLIAALLAPGLVGGDDKPAKLDAKALVGKWQIKYVTGTNDDKVEKSIEFNADGTYVWMIGGTKMEGNYKLTGNSLALTPKGQNGSLIWKDLTLKDGKIIHPVGKARNELTRVDAKK